MKLATLLWTVLTVSVAISLFLLKYEVQSLEDEISEKMSLIQAHRDAIQVLEAEWVYLNRPSRLAALARKHLSINPLDHKQIIDINDLPWNGRLTISNQEAASKLLDTQTQIFAAIKSQTEKSVVSQTSKSENEP